MVGLQWPGDLAFWHPGKALWELIFWGCNRFPTASSGHGFEDSILYLGNVPLFVDHRCVDGGYCAQSQGGADLYASSTGIALLRGDKH